MKKFSNIIFDFDGVIGDTIEESKNIIVKLYEEFHQKKANPEDIKRLMGVSIIEIIKELRVPFIKLPYFQKRIRQAMTKKINRIKIFKGIKKVLQQIKKEGYILGILSSNSQENLHFIFKKNDIDFFDFIYSGSSVFGKAKKLANLIKKENLDYQKTIYIGDETRDIQAAKENNVPIITVAWGYEKELKKQKPDYFAGKPEDILKIISQ